MGKVIWLHDTASRCARSDRDAIAALPQCGLSPFLTSVASVALDFDLGHRMLSGFLARAAQTEGDGRDTMRAAIAGSWLASECAPAWLRATGRPDDAETLAAAGACVEAVGATELEAARAIAMSVRSELRRRSRADAGAASHGGAVIGAAVALWAGVADRYSGCPGPVWFELVRQAWTTSWMCARMLALRDAEATAAVRSAVEARAWEVVHAVARPEGPVPAGSAAREPAGEVPDAG